MVGASFAVRNALLEAGKSNRTFSRQTQTRKRIHLVSVRCRRATCVFRGAKRLLEAGKSNRAFSRQTQTHKRIHRLAQDGSPRPWIPRLGASSPGMSKRPDLVSRVALDLTTYYVVKKNH